MKNKTLNATKTAFLILLLHIAYIALMLFFFLIAGIFESFEFVYVPFLAFSILMLFPFMLPATTAINLSSLCFQILALLRGESKIKNILMMIFTALYEIAIIGLTIRIWQGAMSV